MMDIFVIVLWAVVLFVSLYGFFLGLAIGIAKFITWLLDGE